MAIGIVVLVVAQRSAGAPRTEHDIEAWLFDLWLAERLAGAQLEGAITASP